MAIGTAHLTSAQNWGFFQPGTVIRDEDGNLWMCYLNWCDQDMAEVENTFHTDHKARFISFDAVNGKKEDIEYIDENYANAHPECSTGIFATNLVPEDEAYTVAWCFKEMVAHNTPHGRYMRKSMSEVLGVNPDDLILQRDSMSTVNGKPVNYRIIATNVAYTPTESRQQGFQPMLRYVNDGASIANNWYYTKYIDENVPYNMLNRDIDVLDTYKWALSLQDEDMPADKWSICPWHVNNIPYKFFDHTHLLTITYDFRNYAYDTTAHKWKYSLFGEDELPKYIPSVYWEPIVMVAYMEIDDDDQTAFKRIYGGKHYTLVSDPLPDAIKETTYSYLYTLKNVVDKYTFVNEERKTGCIYRWE